MGAPGVGAPRIVGAAIVLTGGGSATGPGMPRVGLLCRDLLFGSKVAGAIEACGDTVVWCDSATAARVAAPTLNALIVDLTDADLAAAGVVAELRAAAGRRESELPILGFYSHVEAETRRVAEAAGCSLVVPRSRMMREGHELVSSLTHSP